MLQRKVEVNEQCRDKHATLFENHPGIIDTIQEDAIKRTEALNKEIAVNPWNEEQKALEDAEKRSSDQIDHSCFRADHNDYSDFMDRVNKPLAGDFWEKKLSESAVNGDETETADKLLLQKWRQNMEEAQEERADQKEQDEQGEFDKDIDQAMAQFGELVEAAGDTDMDLGQFFDPSGIGGGDFEELKKQIQNITQNDKAKEICELMGRACSSTRTKPVKQKCSFSTTSRQRDERMKEEVVGLEYSRDIPRVLPSELAFFDDPELGVLFDLKYVESNLMSYKMIGHQSSLVTSEEEQLVDQDESRGPMILAIDTSGSMMGRPDEIAKSVTLYMATQARKENRDCYLITFATKLECVDLSEGVSSKELYNFLQFSNHGCTDVEPAFEHGVKIMKENDAYQNADMLVISDMQANDVSKVCQKQISELRGQGNRFYGLCVEVHNYDFPGTPIEELFDESWVYDVERDTVRKKVRAMTNTDAITTESGDGNDDKNN